MATRYQFSEEEIERIHKARKDNKNKQVDRRLRALEMMSERYKNKEIAEATGYHEAYLKQLVSKYRKGGPEALNIAGVRKVYDRQFHVTTYGNPLCVWGSRTFDRVKLFSCHAVLQHSVHEYISGRVIEIVPAGSYSIILRRGGMAQIQNTLRAREYRAVLHTSIHPGNESNRTDLERIA